MMQQDSIQVQIKVKFLKIYIYDKQIPPTRKTDTNFSGIFK